MVSWMNHNGGWSLLSDLFRTHCHFAWFTGVIQYEYIVDIDEVGDLGIDHVRPVDAMGRMQQCGGATGWWCALNAAR